MARRPNMNNWLQDDFREKNNRSEMSYHYSSDAFPEPASAKFHAYPDLFNIFTVRQGTGDIRNKFIAQELAHAGTMYCEVGETKKCPKRRNLLIVFAGVVVIVVAVCIAVIVATSGKDGSNGNSDVTTRIPTNAPTTAKRTSVPSSSSTTTTTSTPGKIITSQTETSKRFSTKEITTLMPAGRTTTVERTTVPLTSRATTTTSTPGKITSTTFVSSIKSSTKDVTTLKQAETTITRKPTTTLLEMITTSQLESSTESSTRVTTTSTRTTETTSVQSSTTSTTKQTISTPSEAYINPVQILSVVSWESWTKCSVTCGTGVHVRYRTCNNTQSTDSDCEGNYVEKALCETDSCSVYGKCTTWSQWGSCDVSCGGGLQSRSRQCNKDSSTDVECVGDTMQQQSCSEWNCPDCNKICSVGTLNEACDTCVCEPSNIEGRVVTTSGNPVGYALLADASAPSKIIAETNSTGFFRLNSTCMASTIIASRDGFQDTITEITATFQTIYMELEVLPRITEHPKSKSRKIGENVLFCCSAVSAPEITYYEWFHYSVLLDNALYKNNGTNLELKNVQVSDSGEYTCRASNSARGIKSNTATLTVRDTEKEFCEDALQQKQISLPSSCIQPGSNTTIYEVGDCVSKSCRQSSSNDNGQCSDSSKSCCVSSEFETKTINCTDYELELIIVKACSCGSCDDTSLQVSGKVISARSGDPVDFAEVWLNGNHVTYTSYSGSFYTSITNADNAVFTVKDTYNNIYLDTTKVVKISSEVGGTISVTIQMLEATTPVFIDSSTDSVLSLGNSQNGSNNTIALLKVPADSFYRSDGSSYSGIVSAVVTFIDPTDDSLEDAAPGVFQFIDEEGSTLDLESKGIFNMQFKDENGDDLFVDGVIEVSFPDETVSNFTLWKLNTVTGLWEALVPSIQTSRRKRRQAQYLVGEIEMSTIYTTTWVNIDKWFKYSPGSSCYFKTRVYKDENLAEVIINDASSYMIQFRRIAPPKYLKYDIGPYTAGYMISQCFKVPCGNYETYISLKTNYLTYQSQEYKLKVADPLLTTNNMDYSILYDNTTIEGILVSSEHGPFYRNYYNCLISGITESHLRFYKPSTGDIYTARYFAPNVRLTDDNRKIANTVWYPKRENYYMMCLMKIKLSFQKTMYISQSSLAFHVLSFGGSFAGVRNFLFGIREFNVDISENSTYVCVEYKCSGNLEQSEDIDYTRVKIAVVSSSYMYFGYYSYRCTIQEMSGIMKNHSFDGIGRLNGDLQPGQSFDAYIPDDYGSSWGIYEAHTNNKNFATTRNKVFNECMEPYDQQNGGAAVQLLCQYP